MRVKKQLLRVATAMIVLASVVAAPGPAGAATGSRISGADRYETAAQLAFEVGECRAVVANGESFPDGLAGAVFRLPVFLTRANALPNSTVSGLNQLDQACTGIEKIYVLGGAAAVSAAAFDRLRADYTNDDEAGVGTTVILATGENFPDALAAGPFSADRGYPIILNRGAELRSEVDDFFDDNPGVNKVFILGGTAAIPDSIKTELSSKFGIASTRLAGENRAATAVAIAETAFPSPSCALIVNGNNFPDALAAGPVGAAASCPTALVDRDSIPVATNHWLSENLSGLTEVLAIGGTAVISEAVLTGATTADCDPAYPGVCIPSPPPDLNCADVPFTNFTVLPADPHGFDGNNDGVGCET